MLAVGEYQLGFLDQNMIRMSTGFSGGYGDSRTYLCGAFSAGVMIISAVYGRTKPDEDDSLCFRKVMEYRNLFSQVMGSVYCPELRAEKFGSGGLEPCSILVERAANILMDVLESPNSID